MLRAIWAAREAVPDALYDDRRVLSSSLASPVMNGDGLPPTVDPMAMQNKICIPNNSGPRAYQMNVWRYLERGGKRASAWAEQPAEPRN
jgi:hypothetical protein